MTTAVKRLSLSLWLAVLAVAGLANVLFAHGGTGTVQFTNEDIGPYRLFVWSDPEPPQIGEEYHVSVALTESLPDDPSGFAGQPVFDVDITVTMTHLATGETLTGKATHENAINKIYYEAPFNVPETGEWQVEITVQGPDGPVGAMYTEEIVAASFNWIPIAGGALAVLLAAGAFAFHWRVQPRAAEAH